jgi:hypothetical protein
LYTGTGSSQSITGVGFQPDFVWIKERNGAADHGLYDAVRGVQKQLESNNNSAETTESTGLTAFGSDGFTVGSLAQLNTNNDTYVAWNWNGGGSNATNTSGTITSTVRANTTAGFSIVTYTGNGTAGATVGHGLGVAPRMILYKLYSTTSNWIVYHASVGATKILSLNSTAAEANSVAFNNTAPSSTVFTLGGSFEGTNDNSMIAYCFAAIPGYSEFGSYTGNQSTDGPFVYTGFRPAFILIKANHGVNWVIFDTARNTYNLTNIKLFPNVSNAETGAEDSVDVLSNGFKIRSSNNTINDPGMFHIFAAFAESPFKLSLAR